MDSHRSFADLEDLMDITPDTNRETWLTKAIAALAPHFSACEVPLPTVRVSTGWPSKGGTADKGRVIGECWTGAEDGVAQVFISPLLDDGVDVLAVLVHELCHAADGNENGHKGRFWAYGKALGLEGKPTATTASADLKTGLQEIIEDLGAYPHAALPNKSSAKPKQTTRMIKVVCPDCEYTLRTTAKWVEVGLPTCPCGALMEAEPPKDADE